MIPKLGSVAPRPPRGGPRYDLGALFNFHAYRIAESASFVERVPVRPPGEPTPGHATVLWKRSSGDTQQTRSFPESTPGDVRGFAEGTRFILESAIRISGILLGTAHSPEETEMLLKRLELSIPARALGIQVFPKGTA